MLWRLHIRSAVSGGITHNTLVEHCYKNSVAGIGWAVDTVPQTKEQYAELARQAYGRAPASVGFACYPKVGDFIWARNADGIYYLGKITSDWYYDASPEATAMDIPNQRRCEWVEIGAEDNVPGKVIASFRPRRAFQAIYGEAAQAASLYLYHGKDKTYLEPLRGKQESLLSVIDDADCEDLVGLYVQHHYDYMLIPSTCKSDTMATEFILKHRVTGEKAFVQVKQGNVDPSLGSIPQDVKEVFYFTTQGAVSDCSAKARVITPKQMMEFFLQAEHQRFVPDRIKGWMDVLAI